MYLKKFNRILSAVLASVTIFSLAACNDKPTSSFYETVEEVTGTFDYDSELLSQKTDGDKGYNNELFYVNTLDFHIADPTIIQITEGRERGYFYVYGTSDSIGGRGFQGWKSKDLSNWECVGTVFSPAEEAWAQYCYWAPEIIYDKASKTYYMFYNAYNRFDNNRLCLSVAYSKSPSGPFVSPSNEANANGEQLDVNKPVFDFSINNPELKKLADKGEDFIKTNALDASPFVDPATGDKYMYFSYYDDYGIGSFVYGVKMIDWYTPDYSTLTMLTYPGYRSVEAGITRKQNMITSEGSVNEGPFMVYRNGKYYLTLSIFGYQVSNYRVIQAVSDYPLGKKADSDNYYGDFLKVDVNEQGGCLLSTDVANWSHIVSAGHHCFFTCGDETYVGYHTYKNRKNINGGRALAVDKIVWIENGEGMEVMHTNGPTYSVQPLPEKVSGYKNVAKSATVTATNTASYSDVKLLTDERIKYQEPDLATEYEANAGKSVITLTWDDFKTVRAVMIYNSYDYEKTFVDIDSVEFFVKTPSGKLQSVVITDLAYDWAFHAEIDREFIKPGGAAIAEFHEMPVICIKITVSTPQGASALAIGEIVVLGKDSECKSISEFLPYSY